MTLRPLENETALEFVERADEHEINEEQINSILRGRFGFCEDGDIKRLKLRSRVFWRKLFLEHVKGIHERGGSRYAAQKYIQKKNVQGGQEMLSQGEINELIDSFGKWSR